jgi:hypothetical protein
MIPFVTFADGAIERFAISAVGVGAVVAIDIAGDRVTGDAAENDAAHDRAAIAMTDRATDYTTRDCAEHSAGGAVVATIVGKGVRRSRRECERRDRCKSQGCRHANSSSYRNENAFWARSPAAQASRFRHERRLNERRPFGRRNTTQKWRRNMRLSCARFAGGPVRRRPFA